MPYRHAHLWLLALFPLIGVAFWPGYLGQFGKAPFALHAHGMTATTWLVLLTAQSWSIHARRVVWHRSAGLATFIILPLFAAAGPLALQGMASLWRSNADPFHAAFGSRLVIADMVAGPSVVIMVVYAFFHRRQGAVHAAAILATALLVLPPVIGRLFPAIPGFPHGGWAGFAGFRAAFELAEAITLLVALWLASRRPTARVGFGFAAVATAMQMIGFETIGRTAFWDRWVIVLTDIPAAPMSLAAGATTVLLLWWAWKVPMRTVTDRHPQRLNRASRPFPIGNGSSGGSVNQSVVQQAFRTARHRLDGADYAAFGCVDGSRCGSRICPDMRGQWALNRE